MTERTSHTEDIERISMRGHLSAATDSFTRELTKGPIGTSFVGSVYATSIVARGSFELGKRLGGATLEAGVSVARTVFTASRNRRQ